MASPTSAGGEPAGVDEGHRPGGRATIACCIRSAGKARSGARVKSPVVAASRLTMAAVTPWRMVGIACGPAVTTMSQPSTSRAPPVETRGAPISSCGRGDLQVGEDGTAFLRHAHHVEGGDALALQVRGHAEQGRDGDHAGAADAGDDDAVRAVERAAAPAPAGPGTGRRRPPTPCAGAALDGDEARAEALEAAEVLVAGGLVDAALAAELGLLRLDGHAVAGDTAIAAALADQLVDDHPLVGVGERAALAAAALLGGAGLVIDQSGDARHLAQPALHGVELVAMEDAHAGREAGAERILARLVGDDGDLLHALGFEQPGDRRHVEVAGLHLLAAGHGDRVVVEDLEGDVGAGGHGGAHRQRARMVEGAVADILEHVRARAERRLAQPGRALAAHLGEAAGVAVHPLDHEVAADAGQRLGALGHVGRAAVRAAGAEIGQPHQGRGEARRGLLGLLQRFQRFAQRSVVLAVLQQPLGDRDRDLVRRQVAMARQQRRAGRVLLALDHRAGAADGRAAPWPGSRSGRASPRPPAPARGRPAPAASATGSSGQVMPTL